MSRSFTCQGQSTLGSPDGKSTTKPSRYCADSSFEKRTQCALLNTDTATSKSGSQVGGVKTPSRGCSSPGTWGTESGTSTSRKGVRGARLKGSSTNAKSVSHSRHPEAFQHFPTGTGRQTGSKQTRRRLCNSTQSKKRGTRGTVSQQASLASTSRSKFHQAYSQVAAVQKEVQKQVLAKDEEKAEKSYTVCIGTLCFSDQINFLLPSPEKNEHQSRGLSTFSRIRVSKYQAKILKNNVLQNLSTISVLFDCISEKGKTWLLF